MMRIFRWIWKVVVVILILGGTAVWRLPIEEKFTQELRERKVMHPRIESEVWSEMGQTSLAGTFGGLRTVMASVLSLKAHSHFEDDQWYDLKKDYQLITALDPYNRFYWNHAGWHLGYNAASWAKNQREWSEFRRAEMELQFMEEGEAFYREGLKYLPEEKSLWFEIGLLWSNDFKRPDLERAAAAFAEARDSRSAVHRRRYLLTLARIPGREVEAYGEALRLLREGSYHLGVPSFRSLLVVLATNPNLPEGTLKPRLDEVFPTPEQAYQDLYNYRLRVIEEGFYRGQVDEILKELILELKVPDRLNPYRNPTRRRIGTPNWREES